jgi:hypothetical protein
MPWSANLNVSVERRKGCVAQLGAGLAFNVQTRQWQDAFFNADKAFVLRLQYLGDKQSWTVVQRYSVTVTPSGSHDTQKCADGDKDAAFGEVMFTLNQNLASLSTTQLNAGPHSVSSGSTS